MLGAGGVPALHSRPVPHVPPTQRVPSALAVRWQVPAVPRAPFDAQSWLIIGIVTFCGQSESLVLHDGPVVE
jgi:hypothetical protein